MSASPSAAPESRYLSDQEPQGARRDMLERIPHGAEVLDVGCWSGATGVMLTRERDVEIDGVEPEGQMAERAAARYRAVYRCTIEHAMEELLAQRDRRYDALLFLDVLEHLVDPWDVLARARRLLKPGGLALISIPNTAHWSLRWELLRGRWRYRDNGLLDRTHLRFFTRSSAIELVRDSGWEVTWQGASLGQPPLLRFGSQGLAILARWPRLFAVQFLVELRPIRGSDPV